MATVRAMDLFEAYTKDMLPKDKAYIVSSFINPNTGYSKYEVISYSAVKAIYPEGLESLTFQSQGKKLHILVEPSSYAKKPIEPYLRDKEEQIPLRFSELAVHIAKTQTKIYFAKKPIESLSSFSVARPIGRNLAFVFYENAELYDTMIKFFEQSLSKDAAIPVADAKKAGTEIVKIVEDRMAFRGDYN
ncbi:MAG: hypothetical protein FWH12_06685 [Treponema sp.]|nr:hypothetical protein [Treponema sp.]